MSRRRRRVDDEDEPHADDRPPICPACGVTQGFVVDGDGVRFICQECGFTDDSAE